MGEKMRRREEALRHDREFPEQRDDEGGREEEFQKDEGSGRESDERGWMVGCIVTRDETVEER